MVDAGWRRVPLEAGFDPGEEALPGMHQRVYFESPVVPAENGYLYVWVSNESEDTEVWFDDLKVTHTGTFVAQATDYGAWGDVLREQRTDERKYRFGYQGQFAEKDEETGWNHFELREYDAVVGRWAVVDPMRQFFSPYIGMGNSPITGIDSDGGFTIYRNRSTGEEVEVHDGIDKTIVVNDTDFLEAKFFANEINWFGFTSAVGIADAYKQFYGRLNSYSELTLANLFDHYFGGPDLIDPDYVIGGLGALEYVETGPAKALGLLKTGITWQKHHKIPKAVFKRYEAYLTPIMKRNGWRNLINLHAPFHGNHPQYNKYVEMKIKALIDRGLLNRDSLNGLIKHLHGEIRNAINSGQRLNDYFRALN